jgi:chromate reductase, NAD(P)H dehydrogenase (quinone)
MTGVKGGPMRVAALCGSWRKGSFNQALLDAAIAAAPAHGLEIVQSEISGFPVYSQGYDAGEYPPDVVAAKENVRSSACLLLVTPEYNHGVPGGLKNAVDWLSRPGGDTTLRGLPMAVMGAATGYYGTIRAQLAWRQMWYWFKCPVFSDAELTLAFAAKAFDENGKLIDPLYMQALDAYLEALAKWLGATATSA